jgi:hypothetical protein
MQIIPVSTCSIRPGTGVAGVLGAARGSPLIIFVVFRRRSTLCGEHVRTFCISIDFQVYTFIEILQFFYKNI